MQTTSKFFGDAFREFDDEYRNDAFDDDDDDDDDDDEDDDDEEEDDDDDDDDEEEEEDDDDDDDVGMVWISRGHPRKCP